MARSGSPRPAASQAAVTTSRVPPHSLEAETAVLGGVLLDNEAIDHVQEHLIPDDFYKPAHAKIYGAMLELRDRREPTDIITLTERLRSQAALEQVGGATYLSWLADTVPSAANILSYVKIVKERSLLRKVIRVSSEIAQRGYEDVADLELFLNDSERAFFEIANERVKPSYHPLSKVMKESFRMIEGIVDHGGQATGVPTGYRKLDELTCGLQKSDLIIIAGRPSMGKTSLAMGIAAHACIRENIPVAVFSLEMSKVQLGMRLLTAEAQIDAWKIRRGMMREEDWLSLIRSADELSKAPMFIDDTAALSVLELNAKARRLKREHDIGLIVIDYLQLMRGRTNTRYDSREKEISEISQALKAIAKELDLPVVALSQLNRRVEERNDRRPMLSDLRESGAIEQDADVIMFVYREEFYKPATEKKGIAEVIIGKQRNGPIDTVELAFIKERSTFANLELGYSDGAIPELPGDDLPALPPGYDDNSPF